MAEAAPTKDVRGARARDLEARAFEHVPAERAADDNLEIPTAKQPTPLAFERDCFGTTRLVAPHDAHRVEPRAYVAAFVRAERAQQSGAEDEFAAQIFLTRSDRSRRS